MTEPLATFLLWVAIFLGGIAFLIAISILGIILLWAYVLKLEDDPSEEFPDSRFDPDIVGDASLLDRNDLHPPRLQRERPEAEPRGA